MENLKEKILKLKKAEISRTINARNREFKILKSQPEKWFSELCFCILTAGSTAQSCMQVQQKVGSAFSILPINKLKKKMKSASCRFYNKRAEYIFDARKNFQANIVKKLANESPDKAREWLVENIKGIGMKEASHFLRNIGYDITIIDFHILDILKKYKIITKNTELGKNNYPAIEKKLKNLAKAAKLTMAELDLYLWYMETGKVLK
ncbi:MAG: N-glycosylase/DNA lyase [archaeon]